MPDWLKTKLKQICLQAKYIILPARKIKYIYCAKRNQPEKKKKVLRIHRCEHQIASISLLEEWRPPSPAGIQRDCLSCKRKTNILLARKAAHQELKIETSFHLPFKFYTQKNAVRELECFLQMWRKFKMFPRGREWTKAYQSRLSH